MGKQEFKATQGLLRDVMRKQAGSVEKSILEAVMNLVDANASEGRIELNRHSITISDDGDGMERNRVSDFFEQFGYEEEGEEGKEFGKFRMGRGQIFNFGLVKWFSQDYVLVVNLNEDETEVEIEGETHILDTSGLSYHMIDTEEYVDGTRIELELYNKLDNVSEVRGNVQDLIKYIPWLHDVDIYINESQYGRQLEFDFETQNAYYRMESDGFGTQTFIYNKGAFVKDTSLNKTGGIIVSKKDLDVNFARNDILDTCDVFGVILEEYKGLTVDYLLEKKNRTDRECRWLMKQCVGDERLLERMKNVPLIPDITDEFWSLAKLEGEDLTFTSAGNKLGERMMEKRGVVAIKASFETVVKDLIGGSKIMSFEDALDDKMSVEMREYEDGELSKKRRDNLARIRAFLTEIGCVDEVVGGYSTEYNVWKNNDEQIVVHKGLLKQPRNTIFMEYLPEILEAAAHEGSMREDVTHGSSFRRNLWRLFKNSGEAISKANSDSLDWEMYR